MPSVSVVKSISAPAYQVCASIRRFSGIENYLPMIAKSEVEGSGVGAKRICTTGDGAQLVERLEALDDTKSSLSYSIAEAPMPMDGYYSTMTVRDLGGGKCEVSWSSTFESPDGAADEMKKMMEGNYAAGIDGLEELHGG